jgi:hypothetical protein
MKTAQVPSPLPVPRLHRHLEPIECLEPTLRLRLLHGRSSYPSVDRHRHRHRHLHRDRANQKMTVRAARMSSRWRSEWWCRAAVLGSWAWLCWCCVSQIRRNSSKRCMLLLAATLGAQALPRAPPCNFRCRRCARALLANPALQGLAPPARRRWAEAGRPDDARVQMMRACYLWPAVPRKPD